MIGIKARLNESGSIPVAEVGDIILDEKGGEYTYCKHDSAGTYAVGNAVSVDSTDYALATAAVSGGPDAGIKQIGIVCATAVAAGDTTTQYCWVWTGGRLTDATVLAAVVVTGDTATVADENILVVDTSAATGLTNQNGATAPKVGDYLFLYRGADILAAATGTPTALYSLGVR